MMLDRAYPGHESEGTSALVACWRRITATRSGWFWICCDTHFGDIYQCCSLIASFRAIRGSKLRIYLITSSKAQATVGQIFAEQFTEIIVEPEFMADADGWRDFFAAAGLAPFARDSPLLLDPLLNPGADVGAWISEISNGRTVMSSLRGLLRLPPEVEPQGPERLDARRAAAQAICVSAGLPKGNAVLFSPYCRTLPVDASRHFAALAATLRQRGFEAFTSVAGDERPIEGTVGVTVPFPLLADVCEYAGWIVAVRSGVADVVSHATCRKTIIYRSRKWLRGWTLTALGSRCDTEEYVFDFANMEPESFGRLIAKAPRNRSVDANAELSLLACPQQTHNTAGFNQEAFLTGPSVQRIVAVPPRGRAEVETEVAELLAAVAARARAGSRTILACRDGSAFDFYERVDPTSLIAGFYQRARHWHSLVLLETNDLESQVPLGHCLPADVVEYGKTLDFCALFGDGAHTWADDNGLPFCQGGIQFLSGWAVLEPSGQWSSGASSTLKLHLPRPCDAGLTILMDVWAAALSIALPAVRFVVSANGEPVGSFEYEGSRPRLLTLIVPSSISAQQHSILLDIVFDEVSSPFDQGVSEDGRPLGLCLLTLTVEEGSQDPCSRTPQ